MLERRLNQTGGGATYEVVNAGVGNYNSPLESALLERLAPVLKPDVVLLQYYLNDPAEISGKPDSSLLRRSYLAAYLYARLKRRAELGADGLSGYYEALYAPRSAGWRRTQEAILSMKSSCASTGRRFVVLIVPDFRDLSKTSPLRRYHRLVMSLLVAKGVKTVDVLDDCQRAFPRSEDAWVGRDDPHPNAAAHALIARRLAEALR